MHGRNNGKKIMAARIVKHAFDIINLTTDSNPIQILVDAIINGGPREDATRIGSAGVVRRCGFLPCDCCIKHMHYCQVQAMCVNRGENGSSVTSSVYVQLVVCLCSVLVSVSGER